MIGVSLFTAGPHGTCCLPGDRSHALFSRLLVVSMSYHVEFSGAALRLPPAGSIVCSRLTTD